MAEQPVKLGDLFSKCSQLAAQQEKEMGRIVGTMLPLLAYLNEPIELSPEALGGSFLGLKSASLQPGALVVITHLDGSVASKPFSSFTTADCVAVLRESFPELQRKVTEKKRASQVRPLLSMKVVLGGQRLVLDTRGYRLVVSNAGGDCMGLGVSFELPDGKTRPFKPRDLSRGGRMELDIAGFKELDGAERLKFAFGCKDVDGREFSGEESLAVDGPSFQETPLTRKS